MFPNLTAFFYVPEELFYRSCLHHHTLSLFRKMSSFPSPFLGCFFSLGHSALATHLHHRVSCFTPSARQHRVSLFPGARKGKTKTSASAVLPFRAPGNPGRLCRRADGDEHRRGGIGGQCENVSCLSLIEGETNANQRRNDGCTAAAGLSSLSALSRGEVGVRQVDYCPFPTAPLLPRTLRGFCRLLLYQATRKALRPQRPVWRYRQPLQGDSGAARGTGRRGAPSGTFWLVGQQSGLFLARAGVAEAAGGALSGGRAAALGRNRVAPGSPTDQRRQLRAPGDTPVRRSPLYPLDTSGAVLSDRDGGCRPRAASGGAGCPSWLCGSLRLCPPLVLLTAGPLAVRDAPGVLARRTSKDGGAVAQSACGAGACCESATTRIFWQHRRATVYECRCRR